MEIEGGDQVLETGSRRTARVDLVTALAVAAFTAFFIWLSLRWALRPYWDLPTTTAEKNLLLAIIYFGPLAVGVLSSLGIYAANRRDGGDSEAWVGAAVCLALYAMVPAGLVALFVGLELLLNQLMVGYHEVARALFPEQG